MTIGDDEQARAEPAAAARFRIRELLRPEAFPHAVGRIELAETHISWVVLTGPFAYKIKKPVRFDFIDCSTLERRRTLCEEELRLNRRLAAEIYVDVVAIGAGDGGMRVGAAEGIVEYAVRMRQFERSEQLSELLAHGLVGCEELAELGARLAAFHERSLPATPTAAYGSVAQVGELLLGNFAGLRAAAAAVGLEGELQPLGEWLHAALESHRERIAQRRAGGRIRECHGDLHARNVVRWEGRLLPFDCLEFDPALRWIDVASELAFLHMDLLGYGRADLAASLLGRYLEAGGDYGALGVLRLYAVHRALVRAKIDALQAASAGTADLAARYAARLRLARQLSETTAPALIIMHGSSGSGKSWLSARLVPALGVVRVRSDLERKRLAGLAPLERSGTSGVGSGLYGPDATERTYARLAECASDALAGGESLIVDAAFLEASRRAAFRELAHRCGARFLIVSCTADPAALHARVRARGEAGRDASEATVEVLEQQLATGQPLSADEQTVALRIDTTTLGAPGALAVAEEIRRRLVASSS